ncbi:MAG: cobalt-precorrin-5B (C(1))-methyltransferase CbiD [Syntrophobacteraceae bacterium]
MVCNSKKSETESPRGRPALRTGFSSGTAAAAAAVAALRYLISGTSARAIAVKLPSGLYLGVPVETCSLRDCVASAFVIKDGGDDPDVTNGAQIIAKVALLRNDPEKMCGKNPQPPQIILCAGKGIGTVTKPGLPALPGEPAINPTPRQMISENISLELLRLATFELEGLQDKACDVSDTSLCAEKAALRLPLNANAKAKTVLGPAGTFSLLIEIEAPRGEELAKRTLNPRLGITGGLSILGTTGIVRPFSHEAYEQTIHAAFSVASSTCAKTVVLSTGGKSEKLARQRFPELGPEAFVQIADFFSFAVREAVMLGFSRIIHSVFFGKAVKMALGYPYTHAHAAPMDLQFLAATARSLGHKEQLCQRLSLANTARHGLDIIAEDGSFDIVEKIARTAVEQSVRVADEASRAAVASQSAPIRIRLLLFDYDGNLLAEAGKEA